MLKRIIFASIFLSLISFTTNSANKVRVALFDVRAVNTSQVYADKLYSELRAALVQSKKLVIVTGRKEDLIKKIEEWKKSGCTEVECMANAGSELGVDKVISAELREMPGGYYEVDAFVVDVLSQEIEFAITSLKEEKVAKFNELARKIVDAIESKIIIQPVIVAVGENNVVFIDAGADLGIEKGMKFKVERWLNVQLDERGKIIYADKKEVGEIQIVEVQQTGAKAIITSQILPFERGDKAVLIGTLEKVDEPPSIFHSPVKASVSGRDIDITAHIIDDVGLSKALLLYRNKGETSFKTMEMKQIERDKFLATIPAYDILSNTIEYLIKAIDSKNQETIKSDINGKPFAISIMPDNIPPEIQHTPIASTNVNERTFIRCIVKDNVKVGKVSLMYKKQNDISYSKLDLTFQGGSAYAVEIPTEVKRNTNLFYYYIVATDLAGNTAKFGSEEKPFAVKVEFYDITGPIIVHTPIKQYNPNAGFDVEADVKDESGVQKVQLFIKDDYSGKFSTIEGFKAGETKYVFRIPPNSFTSTSKLYYYISAVDNYNNISYLPAPETPFVVVPISPAPFLTSPKEVDNKPPFLAHFTPESPVYRQGLGYPITVLADDNVGISKVLIYYKGLEDREFKMRQLRNFGPQSFGEYINTGPEGLIYYIVAIDYNQNVSMAGSPQDPIIFKNGKKISGSWQYVIGNWPNIPNPGIQIIYPKSFILDKDSKSNEFNFTFKGTDLSMKIEGLVSSYRELKAVLINSEPANIVNVTQNDINLYRLEGPCYKFIGEVPLPDKFNRIEITAIDISGLSRRMILNVTRESEPIFVSSKPEIKILSPSHFVKSDSLTVSTSTDTLNIIGIANSNYTIKSISVNDAPIPFVELTPEEKSKLTLGKGSVKFLFPWILRPGINQIKITAVDNFNNTGTKILTAFAPETKALTVDKTPPKIEFVSPTSKEINTETVLVRALITDDKKIENVNVYVRNLKIDNPKLKRLDDKMFIFEDTIKLFKGINKITIIADDGINVQSSSFDILHIPRRNPPTITVLSPKQPTVYQDKVELHFIAEDEKVQPTVMIIVNNQLLRGIALKSTDEKGITKKAEYKETINLIPGENKIKLIAYNEAVDTSVLITINYAKPEEKLIASKDFYKNSWAVLIGIDDYQNVPKLKYAVKDAKALKTTLIDKLGFEPDKIIEIYDKNATKQTIIKTLGDILPKKTGPDDRVVVFFAGHGVTEPLPAGGEMGYLVPVDGNLEAKYTTCISMTEINNIAKLSPAKHMLFIVDACYGGLAGWLASRAVPLSETTLEYVKKKVKDRGRQLLAAGQKDEQVYESDIWGHSVFTYFLIKALQGGADANNDGIITIHEIFSYVEERVVSETQSRQNPLLRFLPSEGDGEIIFILEK